MSSNFCVIWLFFLSLEVGLGCIVCVAGSWGDCPCGLVVVFCGLVSVRCLHVRCLCLLQGLCVFVTLLRQAMKGTWWMPWHQEPMKDVGACDKPWGVGNRAVIRGCPNGETQHESCRVTRI